MSHRVIVAALLAAIAASVAGFPFEPAGAHDWAGSLFVVWGVALFAAAGLLTLRAARAGQDVAAVGFAAVALYGFGTTLNASLLARGQLAASVGIQPGIWATLALGLLLISASGWGPAWVRGVGLAAGLGHAAAAITVLFGAEMPHTGAEASEAAPLLVAGSKLLLWATLVGWMVAVRRHPVHGESEGGDEVPASETVG